MENESSDAEILRAAQQGRPEAFLKLFDRYGVRVYSFVAHRVNDTTMTNRFVTDTFRACHRKLSLIDPENLDVLPWLYSTAFSQLRSNRPDRLSSNQDRWQSWPVAISELAESQMASVFRQCSNEELDVLTLAASEDLTVKQISAVLNIPTELAAAALRGARRKVESFLEQLEDSNAGVTASNVDEFFNGSFKSEPPSVSELTKIRNQIDQLAVQAPGLTRIRFTDSMIEGSGQPTIDKTTEAESSSFSASPFLLAAGAALVIIAVVVMGQLGSSPEPRASDNELNDDELNDTEDRQITLLDSQTIYGLTEPPAMATLLYDPSVEQLITYASEQERQYVYITTQTRSERGSSEVEQPQCAAWWQYHCDVELSERQTRTDGGSWQRLTTRLSPELTVQIDVLGYSEKELISFGDDLVEIEPTDLE